MYIYCLLAHNIQETWNVSASHIWEIRVYHFNVFFQEFSFLRKNIILRLINSFVSLNFLQYYTDHLLYNIFPDLIKYFNVHFLVNSV